MNPKDIVLQSECREEERIRHVRTVISIVPTGQDQKFDT
jgi:hypothetical protein